MIRLRKAYNTEKKKNKRHYIGNNRTTRNSRRKTYNIIQAII